MGSAAPQAAPGRGYEAVLFDALGTLVELEPPWPLLRGALASHGIEVPEELAKEAMLAEIAYYKQHHMEGRDEASLSELRERCTAILARHLPPAAAGLPPADLKEVLLRSLRFRPYPDAAPVLGRLRQLGVMSAVVSNWDVSLRGILGELGLSGLVDDVVVSAEAGAAKPRPDIFELALRRLRCAPARALFVGDSPETDVAGALAAGMHAVLLDRTGSAADYVEVERVFTLESIVELLVPPPVFPPRR
jgi:HAD superfamily hydrolase (TIGR01509 family)